MSAESATSVDLIQAIASLWKVVAALVFLIVTFLFRGAIRNVLIELRNLRVKRAKPRLLLKNRRGRNLRN